MRPLVPEWGPIWETRTILGSLGQINVFILVVITHHCDQSYCLVHPPFPPHPPIPTRENGCSGVLTALKSETKSSTPASFHNFQAPIVVIGLNANHFHEFW